MLMGTWADTVRDQALLVPAQCHTSSLRGILSLKLCEVDTPTFTATSSTVLRLLSLVECRQPSFHQEVPTKGGIKVFAFLKTRVFETHVFGGKLNPL
ncbi:uncharacterized protein UHOD_11909 [Ustilago sp. UG-2017b]|nr:uncharacterized protein UHOD_11909 [Ustilago sp. UG-2017b]